MNNSSLLIEWDTNDKRQIEDAKEYYRKARKEGRIITDLEDNVIEFFKPSLEGIIIKETELKENEFSCRIHDDTGDRRVIWDANDPDQVKDAMTLYNEYIAKGWRCFAVDENGKARRRIHKFDSDKQEVLFEEKPITQILEDFTKKVFEEVKEPLIKSEIFSDFIKFFKQTKLLPKTYGG